MATQHQDIQPTAPPERRPFDKRLLILGGLVLLTLLVAGLLSLDTSAQTGALTGGTRVLVLAVPAFLAGMLSFLSPCTLPILPAYFAFTFQSNRQTIVLMTVAFFLGLATTMTLLGAIATALGQLLVQNLDALTFWGGLIIIGFGLMSLLGKGFAGPHIQERPAASVAGSYLYGATFALGWTACIGPILGALLTMLIAQGAALLQGAVLSFIYAMGLGMPLIILAAFFSRLGSGSRFWQVVRGKGFEVRLGPWTLYLHTTSILSGVLLIAMGWLLASGQLTAITNAAAGNPLSQWVLQIEDVMQKWFGLN
jgi:cytochrome c-type biogenesis protein